LGSLGCLGAKSRDFSAERKYEDLLFRINPAMVELFRQATAAYDQKEYRKAADLFKKVAAAAPGFDPALRRLGVSLVEAGDLKEGFALLEGLVAMNPSSENLSGLAGELVSSQNPLPSAAIQQRALTLAREACSKDPMNEYAWLLMAHLALKLENEEDFRKASRSLVERFPNEMLSHYYSAIRASMEEDWILAENEIKNAGEMGLDPKAVQEFLDSGVHRHAQNWRYAHYALYLVGAWLAGLAIIFMVGKIMSFLTLRTIRTCDPNLLMQGLGETFKITYRILINLAGIYYYISLPILIFLILTLTGSIIYAFLMIGRIPIKLAVILVVVSVATIIQMIRTLFIRFTPSDPGRVLKQEEAPGLWQLMKEEANQMETRPVDEIRITTGTDLAVYERGTYRQRMRDKAHRILILGAGILDGFRRGSFKAVLAHEYGHFSHRDTAGGDAAMRVQRDIALFAVAMVQQGLSVWWNLAYWFLRIYDYLFRRISYGATRFQEVLADIVAVRHYGASAFEEGLQQVIRRDLEFEAVADKIDAGLLPCTLNHVRNLYETYQAEDERKEKELAHLLESRLSEKSSEDSTHPSPSERFDLARRIRSGSMTQDDLMVWDLFADSTGIKTEMAKLIGSRIGLMESAGTTISA
jgi:Zn-dependent protease with chaperone function